MTSSNLKQWNDFIDGCIDFRLTMACSVLHATCLPSQNYLTWKWNLFLKRFGFTHVTKVKFQTIMISNRSNWPPTDYCKP